MNQVYTLFVFCCLMATCSGCSSFLEEDPKSQIATTNFYKNDNDVVGAVNGIYLAMREDVTGNISPIWMAEMPTDDARLGGTPVSERLEVENLIYASRHNFVRAVWNTAYKAIGRANAVLTYVDTLTNTTLNRAVVRRSFGEARFLRAFYYTRLVQLYGDVPLVLTPVDESTLYPVRSPKTDVYQQIIDDLQYAEKTLAPNYTYTEANGGRATAVAAKALLGYVYMVMGGYPMNDASKWPLAVAKLEEIIANKTQFKVDIMPAYRDIFDVTKKAANKENIFYYKGVSGQTSSFLAYTRLQYWYYGFTSVIPTNEVIDSLYQPTDLRQNVSIARKSGSSIVPITTPPGTTIPIINKYVDNLTNSNDNQNDFHALRYSDVVLMYAESLIEVGGANNLEKALTAINSVRVPHAGLPALTYTDQADLRQKLRQERRRELVFEGKRYYDLIRWNTFVPTMKEHLAREYNKAITDFNYVDQNRMLMPLPYIDLVNNPNLTPQNPGY
ncbi:RagB/SusD family nutrient uptake outer membrane protein [Chryseolinea lacunae]|uniref:RagB/SusD family nutrient uptake outer membrane protein n=1 Tax=Chryseolinea lacunae TaxID=2801331 RepID=A0ABS1L2L9_9BACT|nr:RagB/SusD family nutrient uptake outer membrane protein [Chryseolinea lacunae]MBL0745778.1 RagB/SusD family nutrient uptake outer membrane protein [Chryseolinea lacunae]